MGTYWKKRRMFMAENPEESIKKIAFVICAIVFAIVFMISATSCDRVSADKKTVDSDIKIGCRLNNPALEGYVAVNYVVDLDQCPPPPGDKTVYTAMIIEKYEDKPIGARMEICNGQEVPKGWVAVGPSQGTIVCPREPGDPTAGPTRFIIQRID